MSHQSASLVGGEPWATKASVETAEVPVNKGRPSFLERAFEIVDDASSDELISWNADGLSLIVHDNARFAAEVLPNHFKHNNYPSFVRQLNLYGFKKVISSRDQSVHEFKHPQFRRGCRHLLSEIRRNPSNSQAAIKRRNAEKLAKSVDKLKETQNAYEKRVKELEAKNAHLADENKLLWNHMGQSRQRQKTLSANMNKVMMFLYQAFGNRESMPPGLPADATPPALQPSAADSFDANSLARLPSDILVGAQHAGLPVDGGVENGSRANEAGFAMPEVPHPTLSRHNSLEIEGDGIGGKAAEVMTEQVDEAVDPAWFGDDEDYTAVAADTLQHSDSLNRLVRQVSSDTTGKFDDDVKQEYTALATGLQKHYSDQDSALRRLNSIGTMMAGDKIDDNTPQGSMEWEISDDGDNAAATAAAAVGNTPHAPKRRRVDQ